MIRPCYLTALFFGALLWCGLFLAFTSVINPYGVSLVNISWKRINQFKPKRVDIDRLIKPYEVWRYQPRTVFLGTSRIHQSIDPSVLEGTSFAPAYNASIPASSLGLNISHLKQYIDLDPKLKTVIVELFLWNFLGQGQERPPKSFREYVLNTLALFVSGDTLWSAVQTLGYNLLRNKPIFQINPGGYFYRPPGHEAKGFFDLFPAGIWKTHKTLPNGTLSLHDPAFETVREFVEVARKHHLELIFVLTPTHAYDDYYIDSIHAWDKVEEWLRRLSSEPVTIYSFSQPNDWTYEPVKTGMRYWSDPFHFSLKMGQAMQQSLVGVHVSDVPENFMMRMTPDVVREHIRKKKEAIRIWAQHNPDFVAQISIERQKWELSRMDNNGNVQIPLGSFSASVPGKTASAALTIDNKSYAVVRRVAGSLEGAKRIDSGYRISGWAADQLANLPVKLLVVAMGSNVVAKSIPTIERPDIQQGVASGAKRAGFEIDVPFKTIPGSSPAEPIRVFALMADDVAVQLASSLAESTGVPLENVSFPTSK